MGLGSMAIPADKPDDGEGGSNAHLPGDDGTERESGAVSDECL
jgi:hypothetical protein